MERIWLETYKELGINYEFNMPADNTSTVDVFERNFQRHGDKDAFICMGKALTFKELDQYSRQLAAYLQSLGLKQGDRVAVMMPNILQYPICALGILRAGLILVNVNPLYTSRELEHQLHDSGAKALFIVENFAKTYQDVKDKADVEHVVVCSMGDMLGTLKGFIVNTVVRHVKKMVPEWHIAGHVTFKDALKKVSAGRYVRPQLRLEDTAVLQYTGGTTGVAKGAELTHGNLVANMLQCETFLGHAFEDTVGKQDIILTALPLYHIFSFMVCAMYGMYSGKVNLLIPNPRDLPGLIKELDKYKPSFFPAVNTLFNALVHNEDFKRLDFSNLSLTMGGGMSVLPSVAEEWKKITGVNIIEGYGLSETSPVATANPVTVSKFSAKIGIPMPGTDIAILDDDGNPVALGERGEIAIRGLQVMKGYWQRPDATAEVMTADGFFKSGDVGIMDEKGYVKIVDRKKDMILVSGFNVYPHEVEEVLTSHPKILECGVIGIPSERSGETPKVYIVKKDDSLTAKEVLQFAHDNLTGYKRPTVVEFIDELPKSNVGKILRKDLRTLEQQKS